METNKLTISDQFLTLEQAKELQDLGIDVYGNFEIDESEEGYMSIQIEGTFADDAYNYNGKVYPTLSVAEMIEMLPDNTEIESVNGYLIYNDRLKINGGIYKPLLRDALFEMLKWLKQNKFI